MSRLLLCKPCFSYGRAWLVISSLPIGASAWRRFFFRFSSWRGGLAMLLACLSVPAAQASLVIEGTRVIYPSNVPEVVVKMTNEGASPSLMQAWIDDGQPRATPDQLDVPFFITPPLARVEPGKGQALRIFFTGYGDPKKTLPTDRETLFWLNVLDVPPKQEAGEDVGAVMQISVRSRLKMFYRPASLPGTAEGSLSQLVFEAAPGGKVTVRNPTPYYINVRDLSFGPDNAPTHKLPATMLAPFSSQVLEAGPGAPKQVRYAAISDLGAIYFFEKTIAAR
ncbi:molecular chaperone [Bordetella trematum]|nr:molecular chaperone [Bordetella trematum]